MNFLFEIGIEELPARYVNQAEEDLKSILSKELSENRIKFDDIDSFSTPRRFAVIVKNISERQEDLDKKSVGPSVEIAYKDGTLTKAGEGFIKSQKATENDVKIIENEKGKYISVEQYIKGKNVKEILPSILTDVIKKIEFEKNMKWSDKSFRFARPIKWFLSILNNEILEFEFEGIKSSNITRGMRVFGSQEIVINNTDKYEKKLEENFVIANRDKRRISILESIKNNCEQDGDKVITNNYLLEEVVNLIEYPFAIKGEFNKEYLKLPEDIITITMETHQRYFPVVDNNGKLTNKFVVIRNANEYSEEVKKGNEKVIEPRLADAKFFYDEDLKTDFSKNVDRLKNIVFQKDMGTIYEKVERSLEIAKYLIEETKLKEKQEDILRTVKLAKADLVTNVIGEKEFTKLQGFMGEVYARKQGENENVAKGIFEHYLPRYQGDILPSTIEGAIAGIADKMDTVIGCFAVGLKPTSSKDPYAIRRAVQGIIYVALHKNISIDYNDLVDYSISIFGKSKEVKEKNIDIDVKEFFKQRLLNVLSEQYDKNMIQYVIDTDTNIASLVEKLKIIKELNEKNEFDTMINLLKRVNNIIKDEDNIENNNTIDSSLFENEHEKSLYELTLKLDKVNDFKEFTNLLISNSNNINNFFNNVMINVENEKIKYNRIKLLFELIKTPLKVFKI